MIDTFMIPPLELGLYEHYKGNKYRVIGVGCHSETHDYYVVYETLEPQPDKPDIWLRPYEMFIETVDIDGKTVPRFKKIGE